MSRSAQAEGRLMRALPLAAGSRWCQGLPSCPGALPRMTHELRALWPSTRAGCLPGERGSMPGRPRAPSVSRGCAEPPPGPVGSLQIRPASARSMPARAQSTRVAPRAGRGGTTRQRRLGAPAAPRAGAHALLGPPCRINYTASRFRPFARRRLRVLRPPLVFMRTRNPCVRLRFRRFG